MRNFLYLFTSVLLLTGCRTNPANDLFLNAESLMSSAPDSALRLLEGIDPATLRSRALRARYALLRSQALDKNGVDLKSDSIIAPAAAYYARHGSKRDRAYMHYYLGRIHNNAGRIGEAAQAMKAAEKFAEPLGETYLLGLIYNCRGNLYYSQYSLDEALAMYEKADSCFRLEGKSVFSGYMAKAKATTYALMKNFSASQIEYNKALTIFDSIGNHQQVCLISSSLAMQMKNHHKKPTTEIKKFLSDTYRRHSSGIIPPIDYPIWAGIYLEENKLDSARYYGNLALSINWQNPHEQNGVQSYASRIEESNGNYKSALDHLRKAYFLLDSISFYEKGNLVQRIEERYENKELQHRNEILRMRNHSYIFIGALILTVLLSCFILILRRRKEIIRRHEEECKRHQAYIEELNENFGTLKGQYEAFLKEAESRSEEEANIVKMLGKRLTAMKELLGDAYTGVCNPQNFYNRFKDYVAEMKKEEGVFSELHHVLNKQYYGFVDYFFGLHPTLTQNEKHFIYMLLYKFPVDGIRFIFDHNNTDTYYSQKYKLRMKLKFPSCMGEKIENRLLELAKEYKAAKIQRNGQQRPTI